MKNMTIQIRWMMGMLVLLLAGCDKESDDMVLPVGRREIVVSGVGTGFVQKRDLIGQNETGPKFGEFYFLKTMVLNNQPLGKPRRNVLDRKEERMRSHRLWRALSERRGEGYVDVIVLVLCAVMVLALAMRVLPIFIQKQQLDTFATELVREAEVSGRVGAETSRRAAVLSEKTGLHPDILWSSHGRIQLNEEVTVTLTMDTNIGLFGEFASFPVTLRAQAAGKSEVYWK